VRGTLLDANVKQAAVDHDAGLAYVVPVEGQTAEDAIEALNRTGRYRAERR
jgi:hypothetical protein